MLPPDGNSARVRPVARGIEHARRSECSYPEGTAGHCPSLDDSARDGNGKMDIRRGSSVQSDGIVLTMLLCSVNGISGICSNLIKNIITRLVRTYRCTRTRRSRVPSRLSVTRWRCQFWADCTTNISERKFPTGTGCHPNRAQAKMRNKYVPQTARISIADITNAFWGITLSSR